MQQVACHAFQYPMDKVEAASNIMRMSVSRCDETLTHRLACRKLLAGLSFFVESRVAAISFTLSTHESLQESLSQVEKKQSR